MATEGFKNNLENSSFRVEEVSPEYRDRMGAHVTGTHKVVYSGNRNTDGWPIAWGMGKEEAERVAACLNLLKGFSTPAIEGAIIEDRKLYINTGGN